MIRVLVVDDSLFMRTVIRDMLGKNPDIEVVGTAPDGVIALEKIKELSPDVMTLDIEMPRMTGLQLLEHRRLINNFPKTLMLSSLATRDGEATKQALQLGADDFMLKPKDIKNVKDSGQELISRVRNLVRLSYRKREDKPTHEPAKNLVVIGCSAGGPPMLDTILSSIRAPLAAAVLITQHMPEGGFTAALATRLNRLSPMPVKETENGDILLKGQVFISKAGYHTLVTGIKTANGAVAGKVIHSRTPPIHSVRPAVDHTFISAAEVFGPRVVSILLSGMGSDGGEGTRAVKAKGGFTMAARSEDCLVYGMVRSALEKGGVDRILPLSSLAEDLERLISARGVV